MTTTEQAFAWKTSTFALTVQDVAKLLGLPQDAVVRLMVTGQLGFWMMPDPERGAGLPLSAARFDPDDVVAYKQSLPGLPLSAAAGVLDNLRQYVLTRGITQDYDKALREGLPLRTRSGVHVRLKSVVAFAIEQQGPVAAQLEASTEDVFGQVGMHRARSLTPIGESRQRWHYWWRVPGALLAEGGDLNLAELISPSSALADGERVVASPDGSGPVVDVPVTAREMDWGMPEPEGG